MTRLKVRREVLTLEMEQLYCKIGFIGATTDDPTVLLLEPVTDAAREFVVLEGILKDDTASPDARLAALDRRQQLAEEAGSIDWAVARARATKAVERRKREDRERRRWS